MKKRPIPKRMWIIVDTDPESSFYSECFTTQKEARENCRRLNKIPGYEPSCRVVEYRAAAPKRSAAK